MYVVCIYNTGFQILLNSIAEVNVDKKIKSKQDKKDFAALMEQIMILTQNIGDKAPGTVILEASLPINTEAEILSLEKERTDKQKITITMVYNAAT